MLFSTSESNVGGSANTIDAAHFNRPGVTFTASSGDGGYGGTTQYPASSAFLTAVGGTTLALNGSGSRASENTWARAGSGCSAFVPKPSWQTDGGCGMRTVADVAAVAGECDTWDALEVQLSSQH